MSRSSTLRARARVRRILARARRRPLTRRQTRALALAVVTALPAHYGATGHMEYDDTCRTRTVTGWQAHRHCLLLDADKPVIVTPTGVYRLAPWGTDGPDRPLYR